MSLSDASGLPLIFNVIPSGCLWIETVAETPSS